MSKTSRGPDWTDDENRLVVSTYFQMMEDELAGKDIDKTAIYRAVSAELVRRTEDSVARKLHNVSAVVATLGMPYVTGLKPLGHYQKTLPFAVEEYLDSIGMVHINVPANPTASGLYLQELTLTVPEAPDAGRDAQRSMARIVRKFDPAMRDARNRELGEYGEKLVFDFECKRLLAADRPDLARQVEWVSQEDGDGAGYDILSFDLDGNPLHMEVKTTNGGSFSPFYMTENERLFAEENKKQGFRLVRVYQAATEPKAYSARSPLGTRFDFRAQNYRVHLR